MVLCLWRFLMDVYTLNADGTRFAIPGRKVRVVGEINNKPYDKYRVARYYEQFGNFNVTCVRIGNKDYVGFEREAEDSNEPVLYLDKCRKDSTSPS